VNRSPAAKQALDAPRKSVFMVDPGKLVLIGLDTEDGPEHPLYDETVTDEPDETMAESLGIHGQQQAIVCRKNGDALEVIAGRTRTKAARLWNDCHPDDPIVLECRIVRGKTDVELLELLVVENEHRRDKSPIVKARLALRLLERGRTVAQVAAVFRVGIETIKTWTGEDTMSAGLVDLAPEIQTAMEGGLSIAQAQSVESLSHKDQAAALEIARETGERLSTVAEGLGVRMPPRRRIGSSHNPSTRPSLADVRAAIEDETIDLNTIPTLRFAQWVVGDVPYLLAKDD